MGDFVKEMNYGSLKPNSVAARPQILRLKSDNQSYVAGDVIRIEIPTKVAGMHLFPQDSYIEGKVTFITTTQAATVDGNVYSCFKSIRVIHGSNVVEHCLNVGNLWHVINDIQRGNDARVEDSVCKLAASTDALGASVSVGSYQCSLNGLALATGTNVAYFSFCLPSSILGSLCSKALPLHEMGASSLYLELELNDANNMIASTTAGSVMTSATFSELYYNAKVSLLPPDIDHALIASLGGRIIIPATSWKTETKSLAAAPSAFNDKFAFQVSSCNAFMFWHQVTESNNNIDNRSVTSRTNNNIVDYYLNIGGEQYPSQPILCKNTNNCRPLMEVRRAFDMLGTNEGIGVLDYNVYSHANVAAATAAREKNTSAITHNRWVAAIDLNRFNASQDTLLSGTNLIGSSVNLACTYTAASQLATTIYAAVMFDTMYTIQDGLLVANT